MIPVEMTHYFSWIVWRLEERDGKPTKVPYSPRTLMRASVIDPSHWATYSEAVQLLQSGHGSFSGLGFVFSTNDPFAGIDIDNPNGDPVKTQRAQAILAAFNNTYAETSPSGNGMHIIVRGAVAEGRRRGGIEVYSTGRYFTMTGQTYVDLPISESPYLQQLWDEIGGNNTPAPELVVGSPQRYTDEEIYNKACQTNDKFLELFQGHYAQWYSSQSEADIALINIISFYSRNREQIARIFYLSELGKRPKAHRKDYLSKMINKSFDNLPPDISLDQLMSNLERQLAEVREAKKKNPTPMLGEGWTLPPGLLGEIAHFIHSAAPRPVQEVALAGAIGLMSGICGRSYNVSNTGLNQYILLLAMTGRGKEAARSGINKLMSKVSETIPNARDFIGPADIASGQALIKYLGTNPCFISILGEFGLQMQQMCHPHAPAAQVTLRKVILDLFGKSGKHDTLNPTIYSDKQNNTSVVQSPSFSILGETTPDSFFPHLSEDIVAQGLLPRFMCIEYNGPRQQLNKHHAACEPSEQLVATLGTLCANALTLAHNHATIDVLEGDDAKLFINQFDLECDRRVNECESEVARQLWTRAHLKLMKLAALIAVGCDIFTPVITLEIAQWCRNLVERDIANILERFESGRIGRDSNEQNQVNRVLQVAQDYITRPYSSLARYVINEQMHRDKVIQYSFLSKRLIGQPAFKEDRMGSSFALKRTLDVLVADGVIMEINASQLTQHYGYTGKAYYITDAKKLS